MSIGQDSIQSYINNFRRKFSQYLKPGIGLSCRILPTGGNGTIVEFTMGPGIQNTDIYEDINSTMGKALGKVDQHAFGGNLDGFVFKGTNVVLEPNRIIFIKDDNESEWSDATAEMDIKQVLTRGTEAGT